MVLFAVILYKVTMSDGSFEVMNQHNYLLSLQLLNIYQIKNHCLDAWPTNVMSWLLIAVKGSTYLVIQYISVVLKNGILCQK